MLIIGFLSIFRLLLCDLAECRRVKAGFAQPPELPLPRYPRIKPNACQRGIRGINWQTITAH